MVTVYVVYPYDGEYWAPVAVFSTRELAEKHCKEMREQDPGCDYCVSEHTLDCEA